MILPPPEKVYASANSAVGSSLFTCIKTDWGVKSTEYFLYNNIIIYIDADFKLIT